jgi:TetR/AcrR family transcriptional regulator, mexCD-oprJ operon repressor
MAAQTGRQARRFGRPGRRAGEGSDDLPRRLDAQRNERLILEAAGRELAADPKASMCAIAERSGFGRATVYRHFADREELVRAIHRLALDDAEGAIEASRPQEGPARQALARLVEGLLEVGDRYRIAVELHARDPLLRRRERALARPVVDLVERGQATGELRGDIPSAWVPQALAGLLAAAMRALREGLIERDQAAGCVISTLLEGTAPPSGGGGPERIQPAPSPPRG